VLQFALIAYPTLTCKSSPAGLAGRDRFWYLWPCDL